MTGLSNKLLVIGGGTRSRACRQPGISAGLRPRYPVLCSDDAKVIHRGAVPVCGDS
jgi:hypothetical protein